MKKSIFAFAILPIFLTAPFLLSAQEGYINNGKGGCKSFTFTTTNRTNQWNGKCQNGYAHGIGTLLVYTSNSLEYTYTGNISNGKFEGQGTFTESSGSTYIGTFRNHYRLDGKEFDQNGNIIKTYVNGTEEKRKMIIRFTHVEKRSCEYFYNKFRDVSIIGVYHDNSFKGYIFLMCTFREEGRSSMYQLIRRNMNCKWMSNYTKDYIFSTSNCSGGSLSDSEGYGTEASIIQSIFQDHNCYDYDRIQLDVSSLPNN
jgi:hypothetical protein